MPEMIKQKVLQLACKQARYGFTKIPHIVTWFAKTQHNDAFLEIQIFASVSSSYIPKALFCSNTNAVLQILFELQG